MKAVVYAVVALGLVALGAYGMHARDAAIQQDDFTRSWQAAPIVDPYKDGPWEDYQPAPTVAAQTNNNDAQLQALRDIRAAQSDMQAQAREAAYQQQRQMAEAQLQAQRQAADAAYDLRAQARISGN